MLGLARGQTLTSALAGPTDPAYTGKYIIRSSTLVDLSLNDIVYLDIEELRSPFNVDTGAIQPTTGTISGSNANRAFAPITMDVGSACIVAGVPCMCIRTTGICCWVASSGSPAT